MLENQKGFTTMWMLLIMIGLLVFMVFIMESGRLLVYRTQLQTAADAGSLAGALTGKAETDETYDIVGSDDDIAVEETSTYKGLIINQNEADTEAKKVMAINNIVPEGSQFVSTIVQSPDAIRYKVEIKGMPVGGVIEKILGQKIDQYVQSTSRVKAKPVE